MSDRPIPNIFYYMVCGVIITTQVCIVIFTFMNAGVIDRIVSDKVIAENFNRKNMQMWISKFQEVNQKNGISIPMID